ncbi:MAG: hypothetical protein K2X50_00100 [Gammaproteobacteria bacterium]|nr:hypothetical protein [Gammaproteobacteria bacterium]
MEERERAEIEFYILEQDYEELLEEIKINPDLEKIKAMLERIKASKSEMTNIKIIDQYAERLSAMRGNLLNHLKPLSGLPEVHQGEEVTVEEIAFTFPAANAFTEMQNAINSFNNEYTGSESARTLGDQIQRLKDALAAVKESLHTNGGTRAEQKAISMIVKLDKTLKAFEKSKVPIPSFIIQRVVVAQVNRMKNSDEFNTAMVILAKKAKPEGSVQFREDSMDTRKVEKEDLRMMKEFIERVDRLQKGLKGTTNIQLPAEKIVVAFNRLKDDCSKLSRQFKENKSDNINRPTNWDELQNDLRDISRYLIQVTNQADAALYRSLEILAQRGIGLCDTEKDKNILRKQIDLIKISPEYLEYQQAKRNGTENEHPRHETFSAVDQCEKLLKKAMSTQKLPLVSDMNNNKLKKFFEENASKFQQQVAPSSSVSERKSRI